MKKWEIITPITEYHELDEIEAPFHSLIMAAKDASKNAYAPYSEFRVGAAVLLENGKTISGNNQENAAYPSGLCAERVALFFANANYPDQATLAIAVAAQNEQGFVSRPVTPCGSCRQVLSETELRYGKNIKIFLVGEETIFMVNKAIDLLPLNFIKE